MTGKWYLPNTRFKNTEYYVDYALKLHQKLVRFRPGYRGEGKFDADDFYDFVHLNNIVFDHVKEEQYEFTALLDKFHKRWVNNGRDRFTCSVQEWKLLGAWVTALLDEAGSMTWINFSKAGDKSKSFVKHKRRTNAQKLA